MRSKRNGLLAALGAAALALGCGGDALAGFGEFDYTATVAATNAPPTPTAPDNPGGPTSVAVDIGGGDTLNFTGNSQDGVNGALPGGAAINFGNIDFDPASSSTSPHMYNVNFDYKVLITDVASGQSGTLDFTGAVRGTATGNPRGINGDIFNQAVAPQMLTLGGVTYQFTFNPSTGPGSSVAGVLQGQVAAVPEPNSLLMLTMGALGVLVAVRHRRKAADA